MYTCLSATLCGLLLWDATSLLTVGPAADAADVAHDPSTTDYGNSVQQLVLRNLRRKTQNRLLAYPSRLSGSSSSTEEAGLAPLPGWALPGIVLDLLTSYGIKKKHEIFLQLLGGMSSELDAFERDSTADDATDYIPASLKRATHSLLVCHRRRPPITQKDLDDSFYIETVLEVFVNYLDNVYADDIRAAEKRSPVSWRRTQFLEQICLQDSGITGDSPSRDYGAPDVPESLHYLRNALNKGQTLAPRETTDTFVKGVVHQAHPTAAEKEPVDTSGSTVFLSERNVNYVLNDPRASELASPPAKELSRALPDHSPTALHNAFPSSLSTLPFPSTPGASSPFGPFLSKDMGADALVPLAHAIVHKSQMSAASSLPQAAAVAVELQSPEPTGIANDGPVLQVGVLTPPNQYDKNTFEGSVTSDNLITESRAHREEETPVFSPYASVAPNKESFPDAVSDAMRSSMPDDKTSRMTAGAMGLSSTEAVQPRQSTNQERQQGHRAGDAAERPVVMDRIAPDIVPTEKEVSDAYAPPSLLLSESKRSDHSMLVSDLTSSPRLFSPFDPQVTKNNDSSASSVDSTGSGPSTRIAFQSVSPQLPVPTAPNAQSISTLSYNIPALRVLQTVCKNNIVNCKRDFAQGVSELLEYGRRRPQKPDMSNKANEAQDVSTGIRQARGVPRVAVVSAVPNGRNTEISYSIERDGSLESARLLQTLWEEVNGCVENQTEPICNETQAGRMTASLGLRVSVLGIKTVESN
ncbi:hypothetical protein TGME49_207740 [Toxoplasma gondii ME49]|uniref:Transmembrane protein n=3 Tax=Toxoplasma gondii TaxID=5811 RepID=B6KP05_TOXGV|nr:hypothetical protein TGME49_207740 [Toxoplasma gondii ME49]EPT32438.1 hypothetical protein TGME49_207740 [Toxoplasma gondii ME49]ESS29382.1 hypothetical protein TGVEG_207740 [Toxoplasma gondii VEG]PIL98494.1 hypothetical protein TGCOUG_207740 [Toxoplasma gondii COUG]CEL71636.1 TPA: hypothetical protein BN1205_040550 [Toxoplasma gondii VEG]|eukprot:XP_002369578.1 hypothetical protein TGME49_207740 [Toxoplasma gondii ME49]